MTSRTFSDSEAKRERVPMLVGLVGPSGSGKTYSALRIATGMQRVTGGEIYFIDTESRRALHYADKFDFRHVEMDEPFSPLDYLAAIEYCVAKKAGVVVIDSMSHEHEGPGGVLDMHEAELDRMAGNDFGKRNKMTFSAWAKPKAERRKLISAILRLGINAVFCFRAKEKLKVVAGKNPVPLGWQPIAGDEFIYEQTINCLLYPASGGIPNWAPDESAEKVMLKRPQHLANVFQDGKPLSEETGEGLALWAQGDAMPNEEFMGVLQHFANAPTREALDETARKWAGKNWTSGEKEMLREAVIARRGELKADVPPEDEGAGTNSGLDEDTPPPSGDDDTDRAFFGDAA